MQTFCNTTHEAWEQCVQCVMCICHGDLLYRRKNRPAFYLYFYLRWGWPFFIQKWAMKCWDFVKIKYLCTGNDSCWLPHGSWSPCWRKTRHCCLTLFISLYSGDVCSPILHKFAEKFHLFCWWLTWPCAVWALAGLDSEKKKIKNSAASALFRLFMRDTFSVAGVEACIQASSSQKAFWGFEQYVDISALTCSL